ncbi:MAG: porin, partial [Roseibium aggregatum]
MKLKSLMLGAAAAAAATTAQAADLPVAPEPVDYVRVCDAYG